MDWSTRGSHPAQNTNQPATPGSASPAPAHGGRDKQSWSGFRLVRLGTVTLLFSATILVLVLLVLVVLGSSGKAQESKYIDSKKMQAVFLNSGQVYFGHIKSLNDQYLRVSDIYYLRVNQQVQPNQTGSAAPQDISLVKLGCELHGPTDEMLLNRSQVSFWENLKDDGQVAKAVATYKQQNPNGQKCDTSTTGTTTPSTTTPAATTPSTTKKP